MGPGLIPDGSRVYVDANVFIYTAESVAPYASLLEPLWRRAFRGEIKIVASEMAILESLVVPLRDQNQKVITQLHELFASRAVDMVAVDRTVLERAARSRADSSLKTPDAIHLATFHLANCAAFISNDVKLRQAAGASGIAIA